MYIVETQFTLYAGLFLKLCTLTNKESLVGSRIFQWQVDFHR